MAVSREHGREGVDDRVKREKAGSRSNPLDLTTIAGFGILAGAVHGVVGPL